MYTASIPPPPLSIFALVLLWAYIVLFRTVNERQNLFDSGLTRKKYKSADSQLHFLLTISGYMFVF